MSMELSEALNKCSQGVIPYVLALSELFKLNQMLGWGAVRWLSRQRHLQHKSDT